MSLSRWPKVVAVAPLAALLFTGGVAAQEAASPTPEDRELGSRLITPDECQAPQADAATLAAAVAGEDQFQAVPINVPLGEPADPESAARMNDVARQVVACLNANDYLRLGSLTTDNGARFLLGGLAANGDDVAAQLAAAPAPRAEEALIRLIAVTDPAVLADGRLAAFVVLNEPTNLVRGPETFLFVFQNDGGDIRLDGLFGFSRAIEAPATPAAGA